MSQSVHDRLKEVRQRQDLSLPRPPNFNDTFIKRDGTETPLVLRPYQQQMVVHLLAMKRFVVGDDCGLGKTIESIAALCQLWKRDPDLKVVVLTKKSSIPQWEDEFGKFTSGINVFVAIGTPKKRGKAHDAWEQASGPTVLIQGYSSACNDFGRLQHWEGYTLIMDEVTVVTSPQNLPPLRKPGSPVLGTHRDLDQEQLDGGLRHLQGRRAHLVPDVQKRLHEQLLHHPDAASSQRSASADDRWLQRTGHRTVPG